MSTTQEASSRSKGYAWLAAVVGLLVVVMVWVAVAAADSGSFAAGVILGEPTGLSLKQWLGGMSAIDAAAAWSFEHEGAFHVHIDYLIHKPSRMEGEAGKVMFYFGLGGRVKAEEEDSRVGMRVPIGLEYLMDQAPLDLFFEVAPIIDLAPATELRVNGGLGIRYVF
jgi:hypothetical protein